MNVSKIVIEIDNFNHQAMADDLDGELAKVFITLADKIKLYGAVQVFCSEQIRDTNGNIIGKSRVES